MYVRSSAMPCESALAGGMKERLCDLRHNADEIEQEHGDAIDPCLVNPGEALAHANKRAKGQRPTVYEAVIGGRQHAGGLGYSIRHHKLVQVAAAVVVLFRLPKGRSLQRAIVDEPAQLHHLS